MRLNMATRQFHAEVDEPWLDLLRPTVSRADYLAQLVRTYGFVGPFEGACKYTPGLASILVGGQVSRAGLIAQDLLSLGLTPGQVASIPQCTALATFDSVPEALGWLYVVERSTLLQDGIRRHLVLHLPELEPACEYLSAYDGRVSDHWQWFGRTLDQVATRDQADAVIDAAIDGFDCIKQWHWTTLATLRRAM